MKNGKWSYTTGGIPDEYFTRGQVPMTKAEVRSVTMAKARLQDGQVVWDIGAGTGSISIEAALAVGCGTVHAVEREADAVELINTNRELFGLPNLLVHHGEAPQALAGLPDPDRVFIGGSGGNLREIIAFCLQKLPAGGRLVINAVVLETLAASAAIMQELGCLDLEVTQVSIAKTTEVGKLHMFKSHNPVFIISGEKE